MEKKSDSHTASLLPRDIDCLDLFALPLLLEVAQSRGNGFASDQEHESLFNESLPLGFGKWKYWG